MTDVSAVRTFEFGGVNLKEAHTFIVCILKTNVAVATDVIVSSFSEEA